MIKRLNRWSRSWHRWVAIVTLLPIGVIVGSGLLLQLKKHWGWVQPPTEHGSAELGPGAITFDEILGIARGVEVARIESWGDIDRLDVRPGRGIVKVRARSRWEIQIDTATGEVLRVAERRSDVIESVHDGSFFGFGLGGDWVKLGVFLPAGLGLAGLLISGAYLWVLPIWARARGRSRRRRRGSG